MHDTSTTTVTISKTFSATEYKLLTQKAREAKYASLEECLDAQCDKTILALQVPKDWVPDEHNVMGQLLQNTPAKASEDEDEDEVIDLTAES